MFLPSEHLRGERGVKDSETRYGNCSSLKRGQMGLVSYPSHPVERYKGYKENIMKHYGIGENSEDWRGWKVGYGNCAPLRRVKLVLGGQLGLTLTPKIRIEERYNVPSINSPPMFLIV